MKKKRRPLFWTISILLILASIGGYGQGDIGAATLWLIVGIILLPPIRETLFYKKQNQLTNQIVPTSPNQISDKAETQEKISFNDVFKISTESTGKNEATTTLGFADEGKLIQYLQQNEKEKQERIKNFKYIPQQLIGSVVQTMESIYIMDTTKNFDTLKGRSKFVEEKLEFLKLASHNKRYITDVQVGLDQYKTMYYDKIPTQQQIAALLKPNEFDYADFHCQCIMKSFQKFYDEQSKQIAALKRPEAIKNRRQKIMDTIREIQMDIPSSADSFNAVHDRLEKLHQTVFEETYG